MRDWQHVTRRQQISWGVCIFRLGALNRTDLVPKTPYLNRSRPADIKNGAGHDIALSDQPGRPFSISMNNFRKLSKQAKTSYHMTDHSELSLFYKRNA